VIDYEEYKEKDRFSKVAEDEEETDD